jgi:5'-3' exonuclease
MIIHLIDGTYELFRHFYGQRSYNKGKDRPYGAVAGVLGSVLQLIEDGATHVGVATDHVIESFRNDLWDGSKTGYGIDPALRRQFEPLELALEAMGVTVWPMVELEADDALASAAHLAAADPRVRKVCIWTPDKDMAQCVRADRVVQIDRRANAIRDATAIEKKFGVPPTSISTGPSRTFPRRCWASRWSRRCCLSGWPHCELMRSYLKMSTSCSGAVRWRASRR